MYVNTEPDRGGCNAEKSQERTCERGLIPVRRLFGLEAKRDLRRQRSRGYIVRSAECRQEVVQRVLVGDVNSR
jgi:hypothetical protein